MKRGGGAGPGLLVALTVLAAPIALAFESLLRWLLFPPEFEEMRAILSPFLTAFAWGLVALSALAGVAGFFAQRALAARRIARLGEAASPELRAQVRGQVFLLTASIPQLPTIASTFAFMFGASIVPTWVGVAICTVSVLAQGLSLRAPERGAP